MKDCCVCLANDSRYKCPICKQNYCSAACCKAHKTVGCEPSRVENVEDVEPQKIVKYDFPTEDTVPLEKLQLLRYSDDVKECLNNPHVRDIIRGILHHSDPTSAIASAMTEPIFVELADACLKVVEPPDDEKPC
ncbi:hypothetical protein PV327_007483 [Microctonus hyperodae]|uniref:HIT-type domain-containing protein n=1 Tax=Microctonus hyperodae TaxID=165561 RepID=A0AA39FZ93_MICHY|nr:hypothetical protein PV327_007483 [Microctonus hyperodae]